MSNLDFAVFVGIPGSLTIEIQALPSLAQNKPSVLYPPLREPLQDVPRGTQTDPSSQLIGRQWGQHWVTPMTTRLNALGGSSNLQLLNFEAPSIDTTDNAWFATGSVDATTDPITLTAPITGTSIYKRSFQVGDYVVWDDSSTANGRYQYEIDRIVAVSGQLFTLSRSQQGRPVGEAYFGSVRAAHSSINFFRMLDPTFRVLWDGSQQVFKFLWDAMIVSAVSGVTVGSPAAVTGLVNLFPVPPTAAALGLPT